MMATRTFQPHYEALSFLKGFRTIGSSTWTKKIGGFTDIPSSKTSSRTLQLLNHRPET
jgi:hypothetical protein